MSLFSSLYQQTFVPHLMHWHSDPIEIQNKGQASFTRVAYALVSDDKQIERSQEGFAVELVTVRYVQIVTNPNHVNFSGFESVLIDAKIKINGCNYLVEESSEGDHGMELLNLKRVGRAKLASRQVYD